MVRWLRRTFQISVLVCVAAGGVWQASPAAASEPLLDLRTVWPCEPMDVFVDPAAPPEVDEAVEQWHRAFRRDWRFVSRPDGAEVQVWMRSPSRGASEGHGVAIIWANKTTRTRAVVEIDPTTAADLGDVARHELGHVAGLGHNDETQWSAMSPYPLGHRYWVGDLARMAAAARLCTPSLTAAAIRR